jgi:hypothetical protein
MINAVRGTRSRFPHVDPVLTSKSRNADGSSLPDRKPVASSLETA